MSHSTSRLRRVVAIGSLAGLALPLLGQSFVATTVAAPLGQAATTAASEKSITESSPQRALAAADAAAEAQLGAINLRTNERLVRGNVTSGPDGRQYVVYERTYRNLPVVGGEAVITADGSGAVRDVSNATTASAQVASIKPTVSKRAAHSTAVRTLRKVTDSKPARLVVKMSATGKAQLAWHAYAEGTLRNGKPAALNVYVDARTGKVIERENLVRHASGQGHHNGNVTFTSTSSGGTYSMTSTAAPGLRCGGQNGSAYTGPDDAWGNSSGTNLETACVDVMYAGEVEQKMLSEWAGRNGADGQGRSFPARVGLADVNAYWNGSYTNYGHNQANTKQATPMDVVAHEIGHGVFQYSGGSGGSGNEPGGLNESTGDILGAATEAYANNTRDPADYEVGEEVDLVGDGPIRYMYKPSTNGDPDCYSTSIPNTEVHAAAGPQNHWFYLLAEGNNPGGGKPASPICSGGPSSVTGIGIQKATKIFVAGLQRKTSPWTHAKARVATLTAAKDLYAGSCTEFNTVKAAWEAVAVRAQSGEPTCTASQNDFSLALDPASGSVTAGASATTTVATQTTSGSAQTVTLSASGLPSGATATFNPTSVQSGASSTLTIATTATTPAGTYQVTVLGSGAVSKSATYSLTVGNGNPEPTTPPDVDVAKIQAHLQSLQDIATNNGGNRRAGSAGYTASVTYVEQKLQAAGFTVTRQRCSSGCTYASDNLIADWPGGDTANTYMFGAHLDGVSAGPGINDNGSGSAALLETALALAAKNPTMKNHVRFAWWTDEEQGLNGSDFYVGSLTSAQRSQIKAYYNFDMVASTNGGYFINHINTAAAAPMKTYWDSLNLQPEENVEGAGRSDDYSFENFGIPTSGYAMGASARKTAAQAQKWGGTANSAYDPCYHASCDRYPANVNTTGLNRAADGIAYTVWAQAVGTSTPPTNDFSVSVSPASGTVNAGQSAQTTLATQRTAGDNQTLSLSASGLPTGASATFSPTSVTTGASSTVTIATSASIPPGTYQVALRAAGSSTKSATYALTVTGTGPGGCSGQTYANETDYPIRDRQTTTSVVNASCTGTVTSARVTYDIVHTCEEDFAVFLVAPNGQRYTLETSSFGWCGQRNGPLTKNVSVSAVAATGSWKLEVRDDYYGDTGTLRRVAIAFP